MPAYIATCRIEMLAHVRRRNNKSVAVIPTNEPKKQDNNENVQELLGAQSEKVDAQIAELTKKIEKAVSIEQQMLVQRQLLALISFVPGFDYNEKENMDLANFYPPKPTVDHHFSRWFLNDPKFGAMEDLQYNLK